MSIQEAVEVALGDEPRKNIEVYDVAFNVKPVEIAVDGDNVVINGHLSRRLRFRPDDQFFYIIQLKEGIIQSLEYKIDRGGYTPFAAPVVGVLTAYLGIAPVPQQQLESLGQSLGRLVDGEWETVAQIIATNVALHAKPNNQE